MRTISALLILAVSAFANYPNQQSALLDAGVKFLTVTNSGSGGSQPYTIRCGATGTDRCAISVMQAPIPPNLVDTTVAGTIASGTRTVTPASMAGILVGFQAEIDTGGSHETVYVTATTSTTFTAVFAAGHTGPWTVKGTYYTACTGACTLSIDRNNGKAWYVTETVDSAGAVYSPRKISGLQVIPQIEVTQAAGVWTFPIEVIGQDGYVTPVQSAIPAGSATTGIRILLIGANLGYQAQNPVDGKCSVKVDSGSWQAITNANATAIGEDAYYGGIGSAIPIRILTLPLADGTITANATSTINWRFNGTDSVTSGCRILEFNLIEPSVAVTSYSITSNVVTVTTSTSHGYSTNNWIFAYNLPGPWGRANGLRQITVTDSTHFTYAACTTVDMLGCTSPNVTNKTVPTSRADADPSYASLIQPVAYVARAIIPGSTFVQSDPSTWTAPAGGNASNGQTVWESAGLVIPNFGVRNNISRATCGSCHMRDGSDLKALNYSNWSIRQRSIFHGLTQQQGDDVAAYIRGLATSAAASISKASPYSPIYQPAPGLDSNSVYRWIGGGGWKWVLTYDNDSDLSTITTAALPTGNLSFRELAIHTQLFTWNQWLPAIYPGDFFDSFNTATSGAPGNRAPLTYYNDAWNSITAGNNTSFHNYDNYMENFYPLYFRGTPDCASFGWYCQVNNLGLGDTNAIAGVRRPSQYNLALFSAKLWIFVKQLEIVRLKGFEGTLDTQMTTIYGSSANGYFSRGMLWQVPFQVAPHFQIAISAYGIYDETVATWNYISYMSYQMALILNTGNRRADGGIPSDWGYQKTFLGNLGNQRPNGYLMDEVAIAGIQGSYDWTTLQENGGLNPQVLLPQETSLGNGQVQRGQQFLSDSDRATKYTYVITAYRAWIAKYSALSLSNVQTAAGTCCNAQNAHLGTGSILDGIAYNLPIAKKVGVNITLLNNLVADAETIYPSHDFDTDLNSACTWQTGALGYYKCANW